MSWNKTWHDHKLQVFKGSGQTRIGAFRAVRERLMTAAVAPQMTTSMTIASMAEKAKLKKEPMKSPIEDTVEKMLRSEFFFSFILS